MDIEVEEDYIDEIMKDKERVNAFERLYKQEEIETMNYIIGKPYDNKVFTKFELETLNGVNLWNKKLVELIKKIWTREMKEENLKFGGNE